MIREANLLWRYEDGGIVMPWYTLPALEWLKKQDTKGWVVFEFGCGYSSIWWRLNSFMTYSVDTDAKWSKAMNAYHHLEKKEFVESIKFFTSTLESIVTGAFKQAHGEQNLFDCVIVDGDYRLECTEEARNHIRSGGHLIFDNYAQEGFEDPAAVDALLEGWTKQIFKQPNHSSWSTAVFTKP